MLFRSLVNRRLGLGAYLQFDKRELGCFTQWKQLGSGAYVLGLEPGNCHPISQTKLREAGQLEWLEPEQKRCFHIEFGIMEKDKFN